MRSHRHALLISLCLLLSACSVSARSTQPAAQDAPRITVEGSDSGPPASKVADMIQRVLPSVVNVRVTSLTEDPFQGLRQSRGEGSGVVIDRRGIIVTNAHVVTNATAVEVVFPTTGERMRGTVVGTAPERDLAVVSVDATDLDPIVLGKSSALQPGDPVVALGYPLGLGATATAGIVSATTRTIQVPDPQGRTRALEGLLQTDAAINPGNSGGALVDLNGRLVGINSAAAQAGAAENIGFAIAIDNALPVINEILHQPQSERAWLGVFLDTVDPGVAAQLGLPLGTEGALIREVVPDSPADRAGLEPGDVVTALEDQTVASPQQFIEELTRFSPGDRVTLEVVDASGRRDLSVELAARPATF